MAGQCSATLDSGAGWRPKVTSESVAQLGSVVIRAGAHQMKNSEVKIKRQFNIYIYLSDRRTGGRTDGRTAATEILRRRRLGLIMGRPHHQMTQLVASFPFAPPPPPGSRYFLSAAPALAALCELNCISSLSLCSSPDRFVSTLFGFNFSFAANTKPKSRHHLVGQIDQRAGDFSLAALATSSKNNNNINNNNDDDGDATGVKRAFLVERDADPN